jgi:hypothetical protein
MSPLGGRPLERSDVTVTFFPTGAGPDVQSIRVLITYDFAPITPIAALVGFNAVTLSASAHFRSEYGS